MGSSRQQEISDQTRNRLLVAATELAATGGVAAMSIQAVADRSGVSRGSVAWHFGSKEGLLLAVMDASFDWSLARMAEKLNAADPRGISALFRANQAAMSHPRGTVFYSILLEALAAESPARSRYAAHYARVRQLYVDYISETWPEITEPAAVAVAILGMSVGVNVQARIDPQGVRPAEVAEAMNFLEQAFSKESVVPANS